MKHHRSATAARVLLVMTAATLVTSGVFADDDEDSKGSKKDAPKGGLFEGKWVNRKRGTSGPMRCDLKPSDEGEWSATFEGTFQRQRFSYPATFTATTKGTSTALKGETDVDGGPYKWTGSLKGNLLSVNYKGWNGNYGEFTLKRTTAAKKDEPKRKPPKRGAGAE